ncbi:MAG: VapE domain-containing protein [Sphingomicrobium sp.]
MSRYGATPEAWDHFVKLGLIEDLLPVVSNPQAEISPQSKMAALGKTPSIYNRARKVAGLPEWTSIKATLQNVERWKSEPDYGICLQTRFVRAIDLDTAQAGEIADAIMKLVGPLPMRVRGERMLLAFKFPFPLTKRVVPVENGIVEILADGQQFIAEGTHPSGERYDWIGGLPEKIPLLSTEQFAKVWNLLVLDFATGEPRIAREKRSGSGTDLITHDAVADWLLEHWETYDVGRNDQVYIDCPFAGDHTADSGPTATAYFPAGTGGYAQGHFVCLHAHCAAREDRDFLDATGYNLAQFSDLSGRNNEVGLQPGARELGPSALPLQPQLFIPLHATGVLHGLGGRGAEPHPDFPWPSMVRDKKGSIEPTAENLFLACADGGMIFRHICYDAFTDNLVWAPIGEKKNQAAWRNFNDADMVATRIELERRGFKPMAKELLRECVHAAGKENTIDTAVEWLGRQRWDGIPRVDRFAINYWGWADTPYAVAVGRYVWTAMAGRILEPGVRADMAPILVGAQGTRKTSVIQAMSPSEDFYAEIKLDDRDDDISRKLRGKLVGELEELRGLNSRAIEEIKAFVSRRRESWVPKFKEFENFFWRRCLLIGTTNDTEFLADPTGERRWLPGLCPRKIDVDAIIADRDQLWAEGAAMFMLNGVLWEDAETLAEKEHPRFKVGDTWERAIAQWMEHPQIDQKLPFDKGYITAGEVLVNALGIQLAHHNRGHELRVKKLLRHMGLREVAIPTDDGEFKAFERVE